MDHSEFNSLVTNCLKKRSLPEALTVFRDSVISRSKHTFGNINVTFWLNYKEFRTLRLILLVSSFNSLKKILPLEYNDTLRAEEDFWRMRSRIN